jgi:MoaA/NifB/PqqE/SkfB family radical SAM enzyme
VPRATAHKKIQLFRAWATGCPVWCSWQVNYRCNFQCRFCQYWADPAGDAPELTVADFAAGGRKLASLGSLLISLAGGEPLIRPDLVEIVRSLADWHMPFLTTNGWLATPELAEDLFAAGLWGVSISIDYADAERHDAQRGRPGAHARALAAIEAFSRARKHKWQRVNWMAVLVDDNLDQLEPMMRMAAERDAYFMVQPYGARKTGSTKFRHRGDGTVAEYLLELRARHPNFLSNPYFLARFDKALNGGVPGCQAGRGFFNIDSTGDIAICVEEKDRPVANLFEHSAREIVERLRADRRRQTCRACWYNCRGEIEALYHLRGLMTSVPTMLMDRGRPRARR